MKFVIVLSFVVAISSVHCKSVPSGLPTACEDPPIEGIREYAQLIALQVPDETRNECDPNTSLLRIPAVGDYPERRCLDGLDDMLATYFRSCAALEAYLGEAE